MQNRKFKKLSTFIAVTMLSVATVGTTAFASPQMLFDSEEGIGIEVHCSNPNARSEINDNRTSVLGGTLWTTWRTKTYRANYDHAKKEHRCTAQNGNGVHLEVTGLLQEGLLELTSSHKHLLIIEVMQVLNKKFVSKKNKHLSIYPIIKLLTIVRNCYDSPLNIWH